MCLISLLRFLWQPYFLWLVTTDDIIPISFHLKSKSVETVSQSLWKLLHTLYFFLTKFIYCLHVIYVVCVCILFVYNLWQKIVDKFTKSSKKGFFVEWFTADFLRFSCTNVKICQSVGRLGTRRQIQAFLGFSLNLLISYVVR